MEDTCLCCYMKREYCSELHLVQELAYCCCCCSFPVAPHTRLQELISTVVIERGTILEKHHCQLVFKVSSVNQST